MPDDAIEREHWSRQSIAGIVIQAIVASRSGKGMALPAGRATDEILTLLSPALASQQAPEGWSKVATLEEAASECSRIGTDTVFASDVTEDFKAGYQAAVNTCCASLALIARHAVPAAMLDAAPSVTLGEVG